MDNQHRKIVGYRELSQEEVDSMNVIKDMGKRIDIMLDEMPKDADGRWKAIGKTHLQEGLMALTRSIAKPDFF